MAVSAPTAAMKSLKPEWRRCWWGGHHQRRGETAASESAARQQRRQPAAAETAIGRLQLSEETLAGRRAGRRGGASTGDAGGADVYQGDRVCVCV